MKRYKFMYRSGKKLKAQHGTERFVIGEWYHKDGEIELCTNGYHCSKQINQAFSYIQGDILAIVDVKGKSDKQDDKECYESIKIVKAYKWTKTDSVKLAIFAAEQVIGIYEEYNKDDKRPRKAIEAAKKYLENPIKKNQDAAASAEAAAAAAAYTAYAAAYAARAAAYAARAAAAAAAAAYTAAEAAASAAYAAAYAARAAAYAARAAARKKLVSKIEKWLKNHINELEEL